jgi:hypothetical protein
VDTGDGRRRSRDQFDGRAAAHAHSFILCVGFTGRNPANSPGGDPEPERPENVSVKEIRLFRFAGIVFLSKAIGQCAYAKSRLAERGFQSEVGDNPHCG